MPLTTMKDLVDGADEEWGDREENLGRLVPFGFRIVDQSLLGIPIDTGGMIQIHGSAGSRKTTLALNLIVNQCLSGRLPQGYHIAYDILESGVTIENIRDILLSILATKYLVYWHWNESAETDLVRLLRQGLTLEIPIADAIDGVRDQNGARETVIRPKFFFYGLRSERQTEAIKMAMAIARNWPLLIFGLSGHKDSAIARKRTTPTWDLEESRKRWAWLTDKMNMRQLWIDHMNEYQFSDEPTDFVVQKRVVPTVVSWQKTCLGLSFVLAQVGVTAERSARMGGTDPYSMGGKVAEAESILTWHVEYDPDAPYYFKLRRPIKSRIGMHQDLGVSIEPNSGAIIGQPIPWGLIDG